MPRARGQGQSVRLNHDLFCDSTVTHSMDSSIIGKQDYFFSFSLTVYGRWAERTKGLPGLKSMRDAAKHDMSTERLKE